jgi:glycosyltransferase involved in cell wall biosynthesis
MKILYIEPFNAGSHARFTRVLTAGIDADWTVLTLPGRHWKWRMRGSAAYFAREHGAALAAPHDLVVTSSYLPLAELVGLCPALGAVPRLLYFHENQLAYPLRPEFSGDRDAHFGFTQMVSALAATACAWSSAFNRDSFIDGARRLLNALPDAAPKDWAAAIERRSLVLPVPLDLPDLPGTTFDEPPACDRGEGPVILWNQRWEFDKNPEAFFGTLFKLQDRGVPFRVIACGEQYSDIPPIFAEAQQRLADRIFHWGYAASRAEYETLLAQAQVVVSTAHHEFFGIALLEAAHFGARPLVPDRLAYSEHFPPEYRYAPDDDLFSKLEELCIMWTAGRIALRADRTALTAPYRAEKLLPVYKTLFVELAGKYR